MSVSQRTRKLVLFHQFKKNIRLDWLLYSLKLLGPSLPLMVQLSTCQKLNSDQFV